MVVIIQKYLDLQYEFNIIILLDYLVYSKHLRREAVWDPIVVAILALSSY